MKRLSAFIVLVNNPIFTLVLSVFSTEGTLNDRASELDRIASFFKIEA